MARHHALERRGKQALELRTGLPWTGQVEARRLPKRSLV